MEFIRSVGLLYLRFPQLAALRGVTHGIFLRSAAHDRRQPVPFNLGLGCGTPEGSVWHNRQQVLSLMGGDSIGVFARQVHGSDVAVWQNGYPARNAGGVRAVRMDGDALVTAMPSAYLFIQVADCQPVLMIDPVQRVIANVHSGWRGSVQNIIGTTIDTMVRRYGCRAEHLMCGIGPSLGPCCAEFVNYRDEIPKQLWRYRRRGNYFDFWRISADQLTAAGVPAAQISVSGMCTRCNPHLFFSYRQARNTGRFAAVIGLQQE